MSSGCGEVLSLADLQTAKKHQIFEAEVITGKSGGVAGGASIDYATNTVTGQTQKTLPAILRDLGFEPTSFDFTTGGTLTVADRNKVVFDPVSSTWYSWAGALPKVIPAGTNPLLDANWIPQTDPDLRADLANTTINKGASLIGTTSGGTVQTEIDKIKLKFNSFSSLRSSEGSLIGDYALLTGWHASYQGYGSGIFKCVDKTGLTDDGGTIAVGSTYAWKRITGPGDATEFGVVPNAGSTFDNKDYILSAAATGALILPAGDIYTTFFTLTDTYLVRGNFTNIREIEAPGVTDFIVHCSRNGTWEGRIDGLVWEDVSIFPIDTHRGFHTYFTTLGNMRSVRVKGGIGSWIEGASDWSFFQCEFVESKGEQNILITPKVDPQGTIGGGLVFNKCFIARSAKDGASITQMPSVWFRDSVIYHNADTGLRFNTDRTTYPGPEFTVNKVTGCDIDDNYYAGVQITGGRYVDFSNNWVSSGRQNSGPGLSIDNSIGINIESNSVYLCGQNGITVKDSSFGSVSNNNSNDNKNTGIRIINCNRLSVCGNTACGETPLGAFPTAQEEGIRIEGDRISSYGNICTGNSINNYSNVATNKQDGLNITT
ncbi:right-handed parallel beta-helix repeat-containing protein [Salmonella enterica]|nr:right-handed parallel beta-helix repeat-containing protein [Salmonella enterica]EKQ3116088.1 right-handed parallel beta-helix repeat-containing protein [Salmonella enterica]